MNDIVSLWKEIEKKDTTKKTIERVFNQLRKNDFSVVSYLLDKQYLKDRLWPNIHRDISKEYLLSIVYLINYSNCPFYTLKDLIGLDSSKFALLVYRILSYVNTEKNLDLEIFSFLLMLSRNINYAPIKKIMLPLFSILVEADGLKQDNFTGVDKEDAYLLAGFFKQFIISAIKDNNSLLELKVLILINLLSYLPVRQYVNDYLKKTNFLVQLEDKISKDLQLFLSYLIYFPNDDSIEGYSQVDVDAKSLKKFNKFLAIAHSEFQLDTLTQYGNVYELTTSFESFLQCFCDVPLETLLKLSHRCGSENLKSMSKNSVVRSLWYNYCYNIDNKSVLLSTSKIIDIDKRYGNEIGHTLGFLNISDFFYRSLISLKLDMQYRFLDFVKQIEQRMEIYKDEDGRIKANGSSIYCVQMCSISEMISPNGLGSNSLQEQKCLRILIDFKGKDHTFEEEFMKLKTGDTIFLIKFIPGFDKFTRAGVIKINSHQRRQYQIDLTIQNLRSGNVLDFNYMLRANESLQYLSKKFDNIDKLYKNFDFRLPKWLENIFVGYSIGESEFESCKDYSIYIKLNTRIAGTFLENLVSSSETFKKRRKINNQESGHAIDGELWMLEISSRSKHVKSIREANWGYFDKSGKAILNERQLRAVVDSLTVGCTLINGPTNSGKTFVVIEIIKHILSNFDNERSLIIANTTQKRDNILKRLREFKQISNFIICSNKQKMNNMIIEYSNLLKKVDEFAKLLKIDGAFGNDSNSARHFYQKYFSRIWTTLLESLKDKKHHNNDYLSDNYPFISFVKMDQKLPFEMNFEQVFSDFNRRLQVFRDIENLKYLTQIKDKKENTILCESKYAKIFVFTWDEIMYLDKELRENWKYDNVIILDSQENDAIETLSSISAQSNLEGLKRVVLVGNSTLDSKQRSLFYKLLKSQVCCELETQYSVRPEIYGLSNSKLKIENAIKHANPGLKYSFQFVDVDNGKEIERRFPAFIEYQNVTEAEYVVSFLMYLIAMNYSAEDICIITTFKLQKMLIQDIMDQKYVDYRKTIPVLELRELKSRKFKYMIVSLVRTNMNEDSYRRGLLNILISSVTHGLYIFGSALVYHDIFGKFRRPEHKLQLTQGGSVDYQICSHEELDRYAENISRI